MDSASLPSVGNLDDLLSPFSDWLHIRSGQPMVEVLEGYCHINLPIGNGSGTYSDPVVIRGDIEFSVRENVARSATMAFLQAFNLAFEDEPFAFQFMGINYSQNGSNHGYEVLVGLSG